MRKHIQLSLFALLGFCGSAIADCTVESGIRLQVLAPYISRMISISMRWRVVESDDLPVEL